MEDIEEGDACLDMSSQPNDQHGEYCGVVWHKGNQPHSLPSYHGQLGGRTCHFLVDSEATDNFVSTHFLCDYKDKAITRDRQQGVIMTNGSWQATGAKYTGIPMQIGS